jgi:hypothetical protein
MFKRDIEFSIPIVTPKGVQKAILKYPTDDQIMRCVRAQKILTPDSGRATIPNQETMDARLFDAVRIDADGPQFDEYEKSEAIGRLLKAIPAGYEQEPDGFVIRIQVPGGETEHHVRIPSTKQIRTYQLAYVQSRRSGSYMERVRNLQAVLDFYEEISLSADGYEGSIPVVHKEAVVDEAVKAQASLLREDDTENF